MGALRARRLPAAVALVAAILLPAQIVVGLGRGRAAPAPPAPAALPLIEPGPGLPETLPVVPTRRPVPRPVPKPEPGPEPSDELRAFGGLGAWVDVYDFDALAVAPTIARMRAHGVRTLYIQTGRYNTQSAVDPAVGPWLVAAHGAGMDVVGWYLPGYRALGKDVRRTVAVAGYEFAGHRFDAVGVDIEFKGEVAHVPTWNERVVKHLQKVRARLDATPVAAITPPPLQMDVAPLRWAGFPWRGIAANADVIMLMSYWSYRDCPDTPDHCAHPFTVKNVQITRSLIGDDEMPIHTIGGVGDRVTRREVAEFARGAAEVGAYGASLYDYRTTRPSYWRHLETLAGL